MNQYDKAIELFEYFFVHRSMYLCNGAYYEVIAFLIGYNEATDVLQGFTHWIIINMNVTDYVNSFFPNLIIVFVNRKLGLKGEINEYKYYLDNDSLYTQLLFDLIIKYLNYVKEYGVETIYKQYHELELKRF